MSELRELYQQVILDHNKDPRNFGKIEHANRTQEGYNPLCGDHLHVYLHVVTCEGNTIIRDISFEGSGCAISKASASLMTEILKGRTRSEATEVFERFHKLVTVDNEEEIDLESIGKLAVFTGVREFPMRVKCATLAWHAMNSALSKEEPDHDENDTITTE